MFSGIIEVQGTVTAVKDGSESRELFIRAPEISAELGVGDSVAVDGACLTVRETADDEFTVDVIGTTLSRTVAGRYRSGARVNLERALAMGGRLDGHLVQGHVDGLGHLISTRKSGDYWLMDFRIPPAVDGITILHGSICINGVSLTVNALPEPGHCQVGIIPVTWERTNLGKLAPGDPVNLEGDLIGKYVAKLIGAHLSEGALDLDRIRDLGY
jgi:riboflavin synthase